MMNSQKVNISQNVVTVSFLSSLYKTARVVQPFSKEVITDYSREEARDFSWYRICSNGEKYPCNCDFCMAREAYKKGKGLHKLIKHQDMLWMITVIPLLHTVQPSVLELVKDVTGALTIQDDTDTNTVLLNQYFVQMNDTIAKDGLTGLYNKKYLYFRLPRDIREAALKQQKVSLLFVDLDKFKLINDKCGHVKGDQVLADVANVFCNTIRTQEDWACRFGGDEFIICLNNVEETLVCQIAERIRSKIFQLRQGMNPIISASIGVYTINIKDTTEKIPIKDVIHMADKQMYLAKQRGGNCIVMKGDMR